MKIGLFFGTFNPIHIGHLIIANHIAEYSDLDEVWLVVTPLNPLKDKKTLLADHHRYYMVQLAVENYKKIKANDIEFKLPQPNYTVHTLAHLSEKFPQHHFSLIMGSDNLNSFHKWKNYDFILEQYQLLIYPRIADAQPDTAFLNHKNVKLVKAPVIEISATMIRQMIKEKKEIRPLVPTKVWEYLDQMNFYQ